jgi:hypothetical protein
MKSAIAVLMILFVLAAIAFAYVNYSPPAEYQAGREVLAGWRSSVYGYQQEQPPGYWVHAADNLSSKVNGTPSGVWVIGNVLEDGSCNLEFPSNDSYQNVDFSENDTAEKYLEAFDASGIKIWLSVEPGDAQVETLIDLVLKRYGKHPSVIGFGVDIEWLEFKYFEDGRPVTNQEAALWLRKVRSYNKDYKLFLKHWKSYKMPSVHLEGTVFVSDSQEFPNYDYMMNDYVLWGRNFSDSKVAFQYGYESDRDVWGKLQDPFADIGKDILSRVPNCDGLYWVDFTIMDLYG